MSYKVRVSAAFLVIHGILTKQNITKKCRKRLIWTKKALDKRERRNNKDSENDLRNDLSLRHFENFCHMSAWDFEFLLNIIGPKISKQNTNFRASIPAKERLAVSLRYLASGDSFTSLMCHFKISKQSISTIVFDVCRALIDALSEIITMPNTSEKWLKLSKRFQDKWQYPNALCAIDGRHIVLQALINNGSDYFDYNSYNSIVLLALVDADYNFLFADISKQNHFYNEGIFRNSALFNNIENNTLKFPDSNSLPGREKIVPYVILGDEAFALCHNIMKPYAGEHQKGSMERVYNYRHCRARRVVENVFGTLCSKFRVLQKPMLLEPRKAELIVLTTIYLHNFLRRSTSSQELYCPYGQFDYEENGKLTEGIWRHDRSVGNSFLPLNAIACMSPLNVQDIRDEFAQYFVNKGKCAWQDEYA